MRVSEKLLRQIIKECEEGLGLHGCAEWMFLAEVPWMDIFRDLEEVRHNANVLRKDVAALRDWLNAALTIIRTELPEYVGDGGFVTEVDAWLAKRDALLRVPQEKSSAPQKDVK